MATFTVHIPAARAGEAPSAEKIVLLRDSFSVPAMLLGPFWLAWNRAWSPAIGWAALLVSIVFAGQAEAAPESRTLDGWVLCRHDGGWRVEAFHNCGDSAA